MNERIRNIACTIFYNLVLIKIEFNWSILNAFNSPPLFLSGILLYFLVSNFQNHFENDRHNLIQVWLLICEHLER